MNSPSARWLYWVGLCVLSLSECPPDSVVIGYPDESKSSVLHRHSSSTVRLSIERLL